VAERVLFTVAIRRTTILSLAILDVLKDVFRNALKVEFFKNRICHAS